MKINKRQITIIILAIFLIVTSFFSIRPRQLVKSDSGYRLVMGTFARVAAVAPDPNTARKSIQAAFTQINKVDELMSDYKSDSEISRVNKDAFNQPVNVSRETFKVLQKSIEFSTLSGGAFDITIGPLVDLWHQAAEANSIPTRNQLEQARTKVGCEKLILDANDQTVKFAVEGMRIDLGGIAKGYAIDKAVQVMQNCGAIGGLVDIGGDIRCFGASTRGKKNWLIGVQDPNKAKQTFDTGEPLLILQLTDAAVATSGGYRRFVQIQGKKYSHIINRNTGKSAQDLSSVTIIAKKAINADALATAVSVMGPHKGTALIEKIPQTEAILITSPPENKLITTSGASKYIKQ